MDADARPVMRLALWPLLAATTGATGLFLAGLLLKILPPREFAVVPLTLAPAAALASAALLWIRARSEADRPLRWLVAGVGLAGLALTLQLLSFPQIAPGGGPFGTNGQGSSLLYFGFHLALAGGAIAAAASVGQRYLPLAVAFGCAVLLLVALPAMAPSRPELLTGSGGLTAADRVIRAVLVVGTAAAGVCWVRRSGPRPSATRAWVVVALALSLYELLLNIAAGRRYSSLWWASLGLRVATYAGLAAGLLWVTGRQLASGERAVSSRLAALDGQVHTWTDATNRLLAVARLLADAGDPERVAHTLALVCGRIRPGGETAVLAVGADGRLRLLGDPSVLRTTTVLAVQEAADDAVRIAPLLNGAPAFLVGADAVSGQAVPLADMGWRTLAVLPLHAGNGAVGLLLIGTSKQIAFPTLDKQLLTAVAQQGAQALRRAQAEAEQHETAAALADLTASLRGQVETLMETAPDAIVTVALDGKIRAVNRHVSDLFGYPADKLVGTPVERLIPLSMQTRHARHRQQYAQQPELRPMGTGLSLSARRANGSEFPVGVSLAPMQTGAEVVVLATVRDLTEVRRVEAQLQEAVQRFTAAFADAPAGMALVDLDGDVVLTNDSLNDMLGYADTELIGANLAAITDPRDLGDDAGQFDELLAGQITCYTREMRLLDTDGVPVWSQVSTSLIRPDENTDAQLLLHVQDLRERKHYEGHLEFLANHDPLTGLFNRRRFDEELQRLLAEGARYGLSAAVLMVDLDNFKYVNDTLGHSVGDSLIRTVADVLRRRLRDTDVIARFGGDEFAVLLPGVDARQAVQVAGALLTAIRTDALVEHPAGQAHTTASIGVMPLGSDAAASSAEDVLAAADLAMYAAKEEGRDRAELYDPTGAHLARAQARFRWLERVRQALENDEFTLVAQPILDLTSNTVTHLELLLRMREGDRLLPPGLFLYIAERHGLARAIDRWVIRQTVALARSMPDPGAPRLELNMSADSLADAELPAFIAHELHEQQVDPKRLVFEITETAAITSMDRARQFVERVTDLGCGFALDDFGAGFGSFYYLKYLSFDYLKIDGEFIRNLTTNATDQLIVSSIVTVARGLGAKTIAEYVGDAETVSLLRRIGVDYAQGYHIGRPRPVEAPGITPPIPRPAGGTEADNLR